MKTLDRNFWKLVLMGVIMLSMHSCTSSHLHYSGMYRITSIQADTVTFKGIRGKYTIPTKGLKTGQRIYLKRVFKKDSVTIFFN